MSTKSETIHCVGCTRDVRARLTNGSEIYPHRPDLHNLPFWKCDGCGNYVGCHYKTSNPIQPLGVIPTPELKKARMRIHSLLDPMWKSGLYSRKHIYKALSSELGYQYHTANIRSVEEARKICKFLIEFAPTKKGSQS